MFYLVSIHEGGQVTAEFVADVGPDGDIAGDLHLLATQGRTNTAYRGYNR